MNRKTTRVLTLCGALLGAANGWAQSQPASERLIESIQGPALYQAYCAVCHGKDAKGNGPLAATLKTTPADLTRLAAHQSGKFPLVAVRNIISGDAQSGPSHGPRSMPVWGPIFSQVTNDQDLGRVRIDNLARYLETIQVK
jgi:mono/diheme cytochrome c family protein